MDRGTALEGFAALYDGTGNSGVVVAQTVTCHTTVEYELVRLYQQHGGGVCKGQPLGKMPELWPFDLLKRPLVEEAKKFVSQIKSQGYEATTPIYEFRVWGPYTEKVGEPVDWTPEEGNHLIPKHERQTATTAWGYQGDELDVSKGCAYLIQGTFTRKASLGHVEEKTGRLIV